MAYILYVLRSDFKCRYADRQCPNSRNMNTLNVSSTYVDCMHVSSSNWKRLRTRSYIPTNTSAMLTMAASELIFFLSLSLPLLLLRLFPGLHVFLERLYFFRITRVHARRIGPQRKVAAGALRRSEKRPAFKEGEPTY